MCLVLSVILFDWHYACVPKCTEIAYSTYVLRLLVQFRIGDQTHPNEVVEVVDVVAVVKVVDVVAVAVVCVVCVCVFVFCFCCFFDFILTSTGVVAGVFCGVVWWV